VIPYLLIEIFAINLVGANVFHEEIHNPTTLTALFPVDQTVTLHPPDRAFHRLLRPMKTVSRYIFYPWSKKIGIGPFSKIF